MKTFLWLILAIPALIGYIITLCIVDKIYKGKLTLDLGDEG